MLLSIEKHLGRLGLQNLPHAAAVYHSHVCVCVYRLEIDVFTCI